MKYLLLISFLLLTGCGAIDGAKAFLCMPPVRDAAEEAAQIPPVEQPPVR